MGKQSKRKNRRHNKQKETAAAETSASGSKLLQRLRHSNARTRHAAMVAILSDTTNRLWSMEVLLAIRERVMDNDMDCAQAAADCLRQYANRESSSHNKKNQEAAAGWIVVLSERLARCGKELSQESGGSHIPSWALAAKCLQAVCGLIESNPLALERFSDPTPNGQRASSPLVVVLGLMELASKHLESAGSRTSLPGGTAEMQFVEDVATYAPRTLHSALDDNVELLESWIKSNSELFNFIELSCSSSFLPLVARLHCVGCLVTARSLLVRVDEKAAKNLHDRVTNASVLSTLADSLVFNTENAGTVVADFQQALKAWQEEKRDDEMEREIIRKVNNRREPARLIARRQKELRKQLKAQKKESKEEEDEEMQEDDGDNKNDVIEEKKVEDARAGLENAREAWNDRLVLPLQLALEVVANLTSVSPMIDWESTVDGVTPMEEEDIQWGPDQEAALLAEQQAHNEGKLHVLDASLVQALVQTGLPTRLLRLLNELCSKPLDKSLPEEVLNDMKELQSTSAACVGNCLGECYPFWGVGLWSDLRRALEQTNGNANVATAMVVALRNNSELRKSMQPTDLNFLTETASKSKSIQRETIEMLGILCSQEEHPEEINRKVTTTLLEVRSRRAPVLSEILNALMDIFGDDDRHPSVFGDLGVLSYFQRTVPILKKSIHQDRDDAEPEVIEQWRETALNASRFIRYKKGQL